MAKLKDEAGAAPAAPSPTVKTNAKGGEGFQGPRVPSYGPPRGEGFTGPAVPAYRPVGTYSAPDYATQLLEKAGYAPPSTRGTGRQSLAGLDEKQAEDLTPYGYRVSHDEAIKILQSYAPDARGDADKLAGERVEKKSRAVPMTVEAYNKLSADQKAAVDFNTALVEAREKDLNSGWMIKRAPEDAVEMRRAMFGEDAPTGGNPENTLRLLERIGFKAPGASKLEDFLGLDMAVTVDELKDLKLPKDISFSVSEAPKSAVQMAGRHAGLVKQQAQNDYGKVRSAENLGMIQLDVIRKASEAIAKARQSGTVPSWGPAATATDWLGGSMRSEKTPFGWGNSSTRSPFENPKDRSKDKNFQMILDVLQNDQSRTKLADSQAFWAQLKKTGYDEKDIDQLFQYLDQRTRSMMEQGYKPMQGQNDATIIRELAGLGPVNAE